MKKLFLLIITTCVASSGAWAQTSSVSATITDSTSQAYANGTYDILFRPAPGVPGNSTQNGSVFTKHFSGVLDASGAFAVTLTRNDFIQPGGSQWTFTFCPLAASACFTSNQTIAAASVNLTAPLHTVTLLITVFSLGNIPSAYSSSEIVITPNPGSFFWNLTTGTFNFWNGASWTAMIVPTSNITFTGNNSFTGSNTFARIFTECFVDGARYTTFSAAYSDTSNCSVIILPPGYTETQTGGAFHFTRAGVTIVALGQATITNTAGWLIDAGVNHVDIEAPIPYGMEGNGANNSLSFSGYAGSGVAFQVGTASATTSFLNLKNVHVDLSAAAAGAIGLKLFRTQFFAIDKYACLPSANAQTCFTTDGTGDYTGIGVLRDPFISSGAGGTNAIAIQVGPNTSAFKVSGGNIALIQAGTSVCFDANGGEIQLDFPNCNTAITAITVEKNGSNGRVTGDVRFDSGVTNAANFGALTLGSSIRCANCTVSLPVIDSGGSTSFNSFATPDSLWINANHWSIQAGNGHYSVKDVVNNHSVIDVVPGGNMFLGNGSPNITVDTGDRVNFPENSDGACNAGNELLFASSTRHAMSWCNNGGSIFAGTQTIGTGNVTTAGTAVTNGTCQAQTGIIVTGTAVTDGVTANLGAALPATWQTGIVLSAHPTATNTVTVYLCNPTAGSITPAATQVNVRVTR